MPTNKGYLKNLRAVREKLGMTRDELAQISGYGIDSIKRAEGSLRGKYGFGIGLDCAISISNALGVGLDVLAGNKPVPHTIEVEVKRTFTPPTFAERQAATMKALLNYRCPHNA